MPRGVPANGHRRRYTRRKTAKIAKLSALDNLIDAFRTARAVEFRHFVEQVTKITVPSAEEFLNMRAEHRAETEAYVTAVLG